MLYKLFIFGILVYYYTIQLVLTLYLLCLLYVNIATTQMHNEITHMKKGFVSMHEQ